MFGNKTTKLFKDDKSVLVKTGSPQEAHWRAEGFLAEGEDSSFAAKPEEKVEETVEATVEDKAPETPEVPETVEAPAEEVVEAPVEVGFAAKPETEEKPKKRSRKKKTAEDAA